MCCIYGSLMTGNVSFMCVDHSSSQILKLVQIQTHVGKCILVFFILKYIGSWHEGCIFLDTYQIYIIILELCDMICLVCIIYDLVNIFTTGLWCYTESAGGLMTSSLRYKLYIVHLCILNQVVIESNE